MKRLVTLVAALLALATAQHAMQTRNIRTARYGSSRFPPGTAPDVSARYLATSSPNIGTCRSWSRTFTGAGSNIATERVAKSAADGYHAADGRNPSLVDQPEPVRKAALRSAQGFALISQVFVAAKSSPCIRTCRPSPIQELVALAKAQPGKLTYGHAASAPRSIWPASCSKYMAHVERHAGAYPARPRLVPTSGGG